MEEEELIVEALPSKIEKMLEKYKDIVSDWTPTTLPPRRVISNQIDFVPHASFPNKEAYKLTPDQN